MPAFAFNDGTEIRLEPRAHSVAEGSDEARSTHLPPGMYGVRQVLTPIKNGGWETASEDLLNDADFAAHLELDSAAWQKEEDVRVAAALAIRDAEEKAQAERIAAHVAEIQAKSLSVAAETKGSGS